MGFYDVYCGASGLSLLGQDADLILLRRQGGPYVPVCFPVRGNYDRYGRIDGIRENGATRAVLLGLRTLVATGRLKADWDYFRGLDRERFSLENFFQMAEKHWEFEECLTFDGDPLTFTLIQADVSDAVAETVATSRDPAFAKASGAALSKLDIDALVAECFRGVEPGPTLMAPLAADPAAERDARKALVRTAQIRAWVDLHGAWKPPPADAFQHGEDDVRASVDEARAALARWPLLLGAVARAARRYGLDT